MFTHFPKSIQSMCIVVGTITKRETFLLSFFTSVKAVGRERRRKRMREPVLDGDDELELSTLLILFLKQFEAAYLAIKSALETKY